MSRRWPPKMINFWQSILLWYWKHFCYRKNNENKRRAASWAWPAVETALAENPITGVLRYRDPYIFDFSQFYASNTPPPTLGTPKMLQKTFASTAPPPSPFGVFFMPTQIGLKRTWGKLGPYPTVRQWNRRGDILPPREGPQSVVTQAVPAWNSEFCRAWVFHSIPRVVTPARIAPRSI